MSIHAGVRIARSNTDDVQSAPENRSQRENAAPHEPPENGVPAHALTRTALDRFLDKVTAVDDEDGGCWVWTGALTSHGYGQFGVRFGRMAVAHRWSYEHFIGPIPEGLQLDHLCRRRECVNPDHLEPVTQRENLRRGRRDRGLNP